MVFSDLIRQYPYFAKTADFLEDSSVFFKRTFRRLRSMGPNYPWAEKVCRDAFVLSGQDWDEYLQNAHHLVEFSVEFLRLQALLEKTGRYYCANFKEVEEKVYRNSERSLMGAPYMWALYFSQVFWETHHRVFTFFLSDFARPPKGSGTVFEVPLGTGIFITHFLLENPGWRGVGIDLGDTAIEFTKRLLAANSIASERMSVAKKDVYRYGAAGAYDRIICGEFLEHLEDPLGVLRKLHGLLKPGGRLFLTVAVWASMIDHIYLYESAEEVRVHLRAANFTIERELVQNVFEKRKPEEKRTPINYCAVLSAR